MKDDEATVNLDTWDWDDLVIQQRAKIIELTGNCEDLMRIIEEDGRKNIEMGAKIAVLNEYVKAAEEKIADQDCVYEGEEAKQRWEAARKKLGL